ncbi:PKS-NRPS hybrid synthetase cheA-like [Citrus sinensis]|uniref:PKS-NRPS hybrid synthetase cheA-like n=2 Tax=Citrus TaxID=2706 RepID=UPI0022779255|nr:PKS-NRPS hybrid synthetase cheA-like [Citrus sinensis]
MEEINLQYSLADEEEDEKPINHGNNVTRESNIVDDCACVFSTDKVFNSREELIEWTRNAGKRNGYVIIIKKSDVSAHGRNPRIIFACERSGAYKCVSSEGQRPKCPKATGTKKCNCPFRLKGQYLANDNCWVLKVICAEHNHPAAKHLEGHSYAGRLTEKENNLLIDMSKSNARPKDILYTIKQRDIYNATTMRSIYNARHRYKVKELAGRSKMQLLMSKLTEHNYIEWYRSDADTDSVKDLFWAHPFAIDLLRAFPHVLIMDCTCKTNRYAFPLLEVVGLTSTEMTFSVCFAYIEREREDNYSWALDKLKGFMDNNMLPSVIVTDREVALMNAIQNVFPTATHILCRWHISKNVLSNCKKLFETNEVWESFITNWNILVLSATKDHYMQHLRLLESEFVRYQEVIDYVKNTWLDKYKEKFVAAWTDSIMHLGNTTSNRVETSHSALKRQLQSSRGTFETLWTKIHALVELQHTEIKASLERSSTIVQYDFKPSVFKELRGFVSRNALNMIFCESKRADYIGLDPLACGCVVRRTHGIPCAHEIARYKREGRPIPLSSIHLHWKKLDLLPTTKAETTDLSCSTEMEMILKRFNNNDYTGKLQILKKLKELANPASTYLIEPEAKARTRGRPSSKADNSTRRDPSKFEHVLSALNSHSPHLSSSKISVQSKLRQRKKVHQSQLPKHSSFIDSFPQGLRPYIHHVKDVAADGNCGFRVVADLIGLGEDN